MKVTTEDFCKAIDKREIGAPFSSDDAIEACGMSRSACHNLLRRMTAAGVLTVTVKGNRHTYIRVSGALALFKSGTLRNAFRKGAVPVVDDTTIVDPMEVLGVMSHEQLGKLFHYLLDLKAAEVTPLTAKVSEMTATIERLGREKAQQQNVMEGKLHEVKVELAEVRSNYNSLLDRYNQIRYTPQPPADLVKTVALSGRSHVNGGPTLDPVIVTNRPHRNLKART